MLLKRLLAYLQVDNRLTKLQVLEQLIAKDAPLDLMHVLTGIGSKQWTQMRAAAKVPNPSRVGLRRTFKIEKTSEKDQDAVWDYLKINGHKFGARELLKLSDELPHVSIRTIWDLIRHWDKEGCAKLKFPE